MDSIVAAAVKLSHKQFRAMLKKFRRKKKRQQLAKERDHQELLEQQRRESSPNYKERELERLRNSELFDQFEERERIRKHKQWLYREQQAQIEFKKKHELLELERCKQEEERKRIVAEFERQLSVESKAEEEHRKLKSQKEEVLQKTLSNLPQGDEPWHNPIAPKHYTSDNVGQEREQCQFFAKTGCCRFGERCSRGHIHPSVSSTILIPGMYSHFSIGQSGRDDFDTDNILEYEDKERYQDFKNFYFDVLPEFKKFGKVVQFKVCSNHEPHLRGNVYVQFENTEYAVEAYKGFNGRYYAGRQMSCQYTNVIKWRSAICGLFFRKMCPKGNNCNFLHVFKNPTDEFWEADRDLPIRNSASVSHSSRSDHSRRSERRSSHRDHFYERSQRRRESSPEYRSDYHNSYHDRSTDSDSDQGNSHYSSSRKRYPENESSRSHRKKRQHRDSKSKSRSPSPSDDMEYSKKKKKRKHKEKKKSKKHKKEKESDES